MQSVILIFIIQSATKKKPDSTTKKPETIVDETPVPKPEEADDGEDKDDDGEYPIQFYFYFFLQYLDFF